MKDIGMTIAKYRKLKGLSQGKLAEELKKFDLNPSTASVSSWEKNVSLPNAYQFLCLCSVLGITDIYSEFISEEGSVLSGLNDEGKKRAREYISLLRSSSEFSSEDAVIPLHEVKKKETKKTKENKDNKEIKIIPARIIRLYDLPASAGPGEFLDGDMFEEVEADSAVPVNAGFGIRVSGDSMEPKYKNGETVWVEPKNTLDEGDIGIFVLNGSAFIKKFHLTATHAELVSLNKAYKPIRISEGDNLVCYGRVLN